MKLGKKPYTPSEKDLPYRNYRPTTLPPIPPSFGHQGLITEWGMLGNDTVGDCVIAGADHETMLFTAEGSKEAFFTTANALADYSAITGYNPDDPNTDRGTDVRTAMKYRRSTGMIDADGNRHKIGAFLALDQNNLNEVLEAAYLFSAVGIGIEFPQSAMEQFINGQPWTVVPYYSPVEGGHYVSLVGFDGTWLYVVTWGKVQQMSVDFFMRYCDEAWAILSLEFLNSRGVSPEGFNLAQLQADLRALRTVPPASTPTGS